MKRALLALESAREINDNAEILPSYKVFLKLFRVVVVDDDACVCFCPLFVPFLS